MGSEWDQSTVSVQLEQLKKVWDQVDADGNGTLDAGEIESVMARMKMVDATAAEVMAAMGKGGEVGFDEFVEWFLLQEEEAQALLLTVYYRSQTGEQSTTTMAELPSLMASGAIDGETIMWAEGMASWSAVDSVLNGTSAGTNSVVKSLETALAAADEVTKEVLLGKVWARVDKDGNGTLDADEIEQVLLQMTGRPPSTEELLDTMAAIDSDGAPPQHTPTHTHTHPHPPPSTHTSTHTHARTHAHAHTHMHTHRTTTNTTTNTPTTKTTTTPVWHNRIA